MKGLFPFLRELFFGPKKPKCRKWEYCEQFPLEDCVSGNCRDHCATYCKCEATRRPSKKRARQLADWPTELDI